LLNNYIKENANDTGAHQILDAYYQIANTRANIGSIELRLIEVYNSLATPT